jgi:hypothetical protein
VRVSSKWKINTKPIDDLAEFARDFEGIVYGLAEQSYNTMADDLLDELQYYPAPPANSTYIRTFALRNGWKIHLQRTSEGVAVIIENPVGHTVYVVGSLAKALSAARSFQARVHAGRWPLASETVSFWFEAWKEDFDARFAQELGKFGTSTVTRRAFTG